MNKIALILFSALTLVSLILLVVAFATPNSTLYSYRLLIGISMLVFGGFLRRQIVLHNKTKNNQ